jgi:hypothetical protein
MKAHLYTWIYPSLSAIHWWAGGGEYEDVGRGWKRINPSQRKPDQNWEQGEAVGGGGSRVRAILKSWSGIIFHQSAKPNEISRPVDSNLADFLIL